MNVFDELEARGLVEQATDREKIRELLGSEKVTFYVGFDPTADSLHVGHFMQLVIMRKMQRAGHRPIAILGGGTTMVGDPTGKTDMRRMMTQETIQHNADCFKTQMSKFVDFSEGKALMLNNADWLLKQNYIEFLREVGVHFTVNKMLTAECFKSRMEKGLSFLEFNYMLMQSFDFYKLFTEYGCKLEMGGNDQWSNIIGGVELIRRKLGEDAYGMTFTLLTNKEGKKMGKTENGAVWLDPEKTSPYDFFQYWRNVDDADVTRCLRLLTDVPLEKIEEFDRQGGEQLNAAKELLAFELTSTVHSPAEAQKALDAARALFAGAGDKTHMPSVRLEKDDLADGGIAVLDLLIKCGIASSKGEGRRLIEQGGISIDDEKVADVFARVPAEKLAGDGAIVRKGKKIFIRAYLA
ncbi:MAG: tyrosine--tRNA ligase [Oscillospiraceae bacterium]|nr:tyrosine--tRNA ligase [Oscillospiraceae bacterium]